MSRVATWPASRFSCPSVMLAERMKNSAVAITPMTMRARPSALRPSPFCSASVRGMNTRLGFGQQAADDLAHRAAIRPAPGLRREATHDAAQIAGRRGARLGDRGTGQALDLVIAQLLGEELGQDAGFRLLVRGPILVTRLAVHGDALAALLDLPGQDV